jgi:hypothetical protein
MNNRAASPPINEGNSMRFIIAQKHFTLVLLHFLSILPLFCYKYFVFLPLFCYNFSKYYPCFVTNILFFYPCFVTFDLHMNEE